MWKTTALQGKNPFYASCTFCRTTISIGNIKPSHCRQRRFVRGPILPAITTRIDVRRTSILDMASDPFVTNKDCASSNPRKKAHRIYDKMLVVIDESLVKRFSIDDYNAWFIQEPIEAGILLWTAVMWHFGVDSIDNYGGKEFHVTIEHGMNDLYRIYTKRMKYNSNILRAEQQQYPNRPTIEAIMDKLCEEGALI